MLEWLRNLFKANNVPEPVNEVQKPEVKVEERKVEVALTEEVKVEEKPAATVEQIPAIEDKPLEPIAQVEPVQVVVEEAPAPVAGKPVQQRKKAANVVETTTAPKQPRKGRKKKNGSG